LDLLGLNASGQASRLDQVPGEVGQILKVLTEDANDGEVARQRLEHWFENAMVRCAGAYQRRARLAAFVSALVMAASLNVDALEIASVLYTDAHLRMSTLSEAASDSQIPVVRRASDKAPSAFGIPTEGTLPLGWENSRMSAGAQFADAAWNHPAFWLGAVLSKIGGLLVTALAASLGAGFWFDASRRWALLRVNVRPRLNAFELPASAQLAATVVAAASTGGLPRATERQVAVKSRLCEATEGVSNAASPESATTETR
jgi:hypothetical protein